MKHNICVDVGNTSVKVGIFLNNKLINQFSFETSSKSEDEFFLTITNLLKMNNIEIASCDLIISSVAPSINSPIKNAFVKVFNPKVVVTLPGKIKTGLALKVDNPTEVGSDLIASMVAAKEKYGPKTIVCDAGTATKILLLDKDNFFSGAIIMPGLITSLLSLSSKAEQLPIISLEAPKKMVARNTIDCMNVGILCGHVEAIQGLIDRLEDEIGYTCKHILTGGTSPHIKDLIRMKDIIYEPDLVLNGLNIILEKNKEN